MAKLPQNKNFRREEFTGQESWIDKLISPLNQTLSSLSDALNKNLGIEDNVGGLYHTFEAIIPTNWTAAEPAFPYTFKHGTSRKPKAVLPAQVFDETDVNEPSAATAIDWRDLGDGRISIRRVFGVTAGHKYTITLLVLPE